MQMRGTPWMALRGVQQLPDRPIHRDRIGCRDDGLEREGAVGAGPDHGTPLRTIEVGTLHVVEAFGIGLPDVDDGARDLLAVQAADRAAHVQRRADRALRHVGAVRQFRRVLHVERPEDRGFGAALGLVLVQRDRQHRQAEHVGQQDELLTLVVALLAGRRQERDGALPFAFGQSVLAGEVVEVRDEAGHQLLQARIGRVGETIDHCPRDGVPVQVTHVEVLDVPLMFIDAVSTRPEG